MAEGNGETQIVQNNHKSIKLERSPTQGASGDMEQQHSSDFAKLIDYGLDERVATRLEEIYSTGKLIHADLDTRALDALKEFQVDGALNVLNQFLEANLEHVSNKSAYLCGVMKTYRQKARAGTAQAAPLESPVAKGPDEEKIRKILSRTGYKLDVTTGQRKYGGPPPGWDGMAPGIGCEIFVGKIPKDVYEDELIPMFETCGTIWDLRLMMDPMTGTNRGYAFVTFTTREAANNAVTKLDECEVGEGKFKIGVMLSMNNQRLFVGNIPKNRTQIELKSEFVKHSPGLIEVIIYSSPDDKKKNRGFCFLEYESHKAASLAKRRLGTGRVTVWGCDIIVDWADPQEEPDPETMSKVKVLYVRNLTQDISEENIKDLFEKYGKVERVKKIKDYAFVHFEDRDQAIKAMRELNGKEVNETQIEVSLAKPPSDKKKKEEILRARERRMLQLMQSRTGRTPPVMLGGGVPIRGPPGAPRVASSIMRSAIGRDYDYIAYDYDMYDEYYPLYEDFYDYPIATNRCMPRSGVAANHNSDSEMDDGYYYDVGNGGVTYPNHNQGGHGLGVAGLRGRAGGPLVETVVGHRGVATNRVVRPVAGAVMRGKAVLVPPRGQPVVPRSAKNLPDKRKHDGHRTRLRDSKRRRF